MHIHTGWEGVVRYFNCGYQSRTSMHSHWQSLNIWPWSEFVECTIHRTLSSAYLLDADWLSRTGSSALINRRGCDVTKLHSHTLAHSSSDVRKHTVNQKVCLLNTYYVLTLANNLHSHWATLVSSYDSQAKKFYSSLSYRAVITRNNPCSVNFFNIIIHNWKVSHSRNINKNCYISTKEFIWDIDLRVLLKSLVIIL